MPPQTVSHFELLEKLGEGGMGAVYKARDTRLDRAVALKFLTPKALDSPDAHERFRQEGRALSAMSHPHVATVYEVDDMEGTPFLALEYLSGGTLRSRIAAAAGPLPFSTVVGWAVDLGDGLAHVHRHGMVHRDIKSSNVMFDAEGRVKLTDFGLAQLAHLASPNGRTSIEGTVGYMAPEQMQGKPADFRSDLFGFGVLLYEMTTGRLPFQAKNTSETIRRVISDQPKPIREARPDLPVGLETIVNRLLEKKPEDRYARASDVVYALRSLKAAAPEEASTRTLSEIAVEPGWSRRWWLLATIPLVALIAWLSVDALRRWTWRWGLPERKHVAVLPFRSIGGDADQQAFCDGITETLTTALTKHGGFSVVPTADARKLESAGQARREYGVNLVITGSVQRRGAEVRVTVSLIDAVGQRQLDAEPVNWPVSKLNEMEDAVLYKISDLLNVSAMAPPNPLLAGASQIPSAYDAYLRGRGYLYRFDKAGNLDRALQQFESAIRQDPKFALAQIGLADVQLRLYRLRNDAYHLEAAHSAASRAIELNPRLAAGRVSIGAVLNEMRRPVEATTELELALKLDPRDPAAYRELANLHRSQKRLREAEQVYKLAIATRPGDWLSYSNLGFFYLARQGYADAERMFRKVIELTPDNHIGYRLLATTLHFLGNPRESEAMFRKAISLNPTGRSYSNLGALLMFQQRYAEAVPVMERAVELSVRESPGDYKPYGNLGDAFQLSGGSTEKATQAWRQALGIVDSRLKGKPDDAELTATRGLYRAKIGEAAPAIADAGRAALLAPDLATVRYLAALTYAVADSRSKALEEIAVAVRQGYSVDEVRRAPEFSRFHGDPAFEQLLTRAAPR